MPPARRRDFLHWAERSQSWIVEDDYDSEFRYAGRPIPALASFEDNARTLYIGSFSKVFSDTLRLGFLVMPQNLIPQISTTLDLYGSKASLIAQRPLGLLMQTGEFYRHIRRMRRLYSERRRALIGLMKEHLEEFGHWQDHHAGMQIAFKLPADCDDVRISQRCAQEGLTCFALSRYYARTNKPRGLLLGFCGFSAQEMQEAMPILRRIIADALGAGTAIRA